MTTVTLNEEMNAEINAATVTPGNTFTLPMESVVIYNRFDLDSIFAAAAFAGRTSKLTNATYQIVGSDKRIHTDFNECCWVGVTPIKTQGAFIHRTMANKFKKLIKHTECSRESDIYHEDHGIMTGCSLYESAAKNFGILNAPKLALSYAIQHFFSKSVTKAELVMLYVNYKKAIKCLQDNTEFYPVGKIDDIKAVYGEFIEFINGVKSSLRHSYLSTYGKINGQVRPYVMLTLSADNYPWAIRIVRMSHKHYVNMTTSFSGYLVDSNIEDLSGIKLAESCVRVNTY